jgi:glutaredoxin
VLCRRPKFSLGAEEDESVGSKLFTALLGLGLLAAMGLAAYTFTMPSATSASGTRSVAAEGSASLANNAPARFEPDQRTLADNKPAQPDDRALKPVADASAAQAMPAAAAPSGKRARPRTVGKKIVDPRLIEARKSVKVTMYSAPWCFICDRARSFLEAREVALTEYNVDVDADAERRLQQLNPTGSIPTLIVDGKTIVGFHPWGLEDLIDEAAQQHFCMKNTQGAVCERLASAK